MTALDWLKGLWLCIALFATIICSICTTLFDENEPNILKHAFYFQCEIYNSLHEEINLAGVLIVLIVSSIFLFPCNLVLLVIHIIIKIIYLFWEGFKKIFKKKENKK